MLRIATTLAVGAMLAAYALGATSGPTNPTALAAESWPVTIDQNVPVNHEFDFLIGTWDMTHYTPDDGGAWQVRGVGPSVVRPVLGGHALLDFWGDGGLTIRTYDDDARRWRLFWTDRTTFQGRVQYWEGTFEDGVGTFVGGDWVPAASGTIHSTIVFSEITDSTVHWEMFHTRDGGRTWRQTDIREYERRGEHPDLQGGA